jgi:hypothetical protein
VNGRSENAALQMHLMAQNMSDFDCPDLESGKKTL